MSIAKVTNHLWIGTYNYIVEKENVEDLMNYDTIINLSSNFYNSGLCFVQNRPMGIPIPNKESSYSICMVNIVDTINELIKNGHTVLVVCNFRIQSSPLIILQYLILYGDMTIKTAKEHIQQICRKKNLCIQWDYRIKFIKS